MFSRLKYISSMLLLGLLPACLTPAPVQVGSPDLQLEALLDRLREVRGGDFHRDPGRLDEESVHTENSIVREIRGLALVFPRHVPVLVANASLAYERNDSIGAQKYLDQALALNPAHTASTLLRVRIAAEGGNLPYARRKLREQIDYAPDVPDLHEALAGIYYLSGDYEPAIAEIDIADRLREDGQPSASSLFHRGLIAEALGQLDEAEGYYSQGQEMDPELERAARRLRWLKARHQARSSTLQIPEPSESD